MLFPPVLHSFLLKHYLLPQFTLLFQRKLCYTGGTVSYKTKMKSLYIHTKKCPDRHTNLYNWYLLYKYGPDTQNFNVFFTSWMENSIKMRKLKKFTSMLGIAVRLIVIDPLNISSVFSVLCIMPWMKVHLQIFKRHLIFFTVRVTILIISLTLPTMSRDSLAYSHFLYRRFVGLGSDLERLFHQKTQILNFGQHRGCAASNQVLNQNKTYIFITNIFKQFHVNYIPK